MSTFALALLAMLTGMPQDSALIELAHSRPDSARVKLRAFLREAAVSDTPTIGLTAAERLARSYAVAWRDSFLLREVARFRSWSLPERREKVRADSLRLAGNALLGRKGVAAAMRAWRESLRMCDALHDSAGVGGALGNIGAGFYQSGDLDSAADMFDRARMVAHAVGDYRTEGNAAGALASVEADRGHTRQAAELYTRAAEIRTLSGDDRGAAADRNNLGLIAQNMGDLDGARRAFEDALTSNRRAQRDDPTGVNLINLGNLASLEGDFTAADARYHEALSLDESVRNRVGAGAALHDLGLLELQRGDYRAALSLLSRALTIYRATGPVVELVAVRRDLATAHAAMGNLQGALIQLREAERLAGAGGDQPELMTQLALARADLAVDFNDLTAAEGQYRRAVQLAVRLGDSRSQADARRGLGLLLLIKEDDRGAQTELAAALRANEMVGDQHATALTRVLLGYAEARRGDTTAARGTLTLALAALQAQGDAGGEAAALGTLAQLAALQDLPLAAESLYRRGLDRIGAAPEPTLSWELHAGLADALRASGARDEATREYHAAVRDIERVSGTLPLEERRSAFLADKWDVYARLASIELERGQTDSAFQASERLRARQLLDLLARGRIVPAALAAGDSVDEVREQDLRRQITVLTRQLEGAPSGGSPLRGPLASDTSTDAVREALARAQEAYGELLLRVRESRPEYAALVTGDVAPTSQVMKALPRDEAMLEYLVGDSTSVVFVVTTDSVAAIDLGVGRHELANLVDFSRGLLMRPVSQAPGLWRTPLRRLYRYLIEPAETSGLLSGKSGLVIVPHAELHYVPFAALLGARGPDDYLIQRYRLSSVPSASVWLRLLGRAQPTTNGVLALAPRTAALPGSAAEVAAIERLYGARAHVLVGARASKHALLDAASEQAVIHLATYGVLNKDNPLFSFVELMPEGGDDGRLEVHDVFALHLNARLVVLSACQTALGSGALADVPQGDDWVGLVQAFHFAGASNVMATLWPVQDRATADLMTRFYTALAAGQPESEALAEAQRATLRNAATAHPFFWAGFTLSGGQ
jgi:CHAT domain-containing protein/tetratricopeptide (TPR) repeat protein